jgi:hypothetical protein
MNWCVPILILKSKILFNYYNQYSHYNNKLVNQSSLFKKIENNTFIEHKYNKLDKINKFYK